MKSEAVRYDGFPGQPGETWEEYAHRLEQRIKLQRIELTRYRDKGHEGNKRLRSQLQLTERALGRCAAAAQRRKEQRDKVIADNVRLLEENALLRDTLEAKETDA